MSELAETPSSITTRAPQDEIDLDRFRHLLLRLARGIRSNAAGQITPSQLTVLGMIVRDGPLTIGEIADREHVKPPSASKTVRALEEAGLVIRGTRHDDRRCVLITATPEGTTHFEAARDAGRTWLADRMENLDEQETRAIQDALPALEQLLGRPK